MITQLEIKNFRGFSEYKIDDIGQVNLLVGTNNCGKTSIIEAIYLLKSRGDMEPLFYIFKRRNEYFDEYKDGKLPMSSGELCRLFHGFKIEQDSFFKISSSKNEKNENGINFYASIKKRSEIDEKTDYFSVDFNSSYRSDFRFYIEWSCGDEKEKQFYPVSQKGRVLSQFRKTFHGKYFPNFEEITRKNYYHIEYVPASSVATNNIMNLFNEIVLTENEELMLDAIRIIDPDITRLASLGELYDDNHTHGGILVKSRKWEERIPIGSFGDGIWRLLGLILSLIGAKNGTLLIDEIDTGLHHSVMSKMWKIICTTAKKLNVQVFATTHSRDCWETLADNAVEDEFADMPIRIHRINKDKKQATTFTNREMHLALNRELEVR